MEPYPGLTTVIFQKEICCKPERSTMKDAAACAFTTLIADFLHGTKAIVFSRIAEIKIPSTLSLAEEPSAVLSTVVKITFLCLLKFRRNAQTICLAFLAIVKNLSLRNGFISVNIFKSVDTLSTLH